VKFIHIADMHFDAPFKTLTDRADLGSLRRLEQKNVFKKIINYIIENKIEFLFIAGDLYEQEYVSTATIEYINNLFKQIPDTQIFITPGNHDPLIKNSYYSEYNWASNVHIFKSNIEKVETTNCNIYGYGFEDFYSKKMQLKDIGEIDQAKLNILIAHADLNATENSSEAYNPITISELKELNMDYIALGHIHKRNILNNIAYPGSTMSLGFDELDEHGMLEVDIEKGQEPKIKFIKLDNREFKEIEIDITGLNGIEEIAEKIENLETQEDLYKIILKGTRNFNIEENKIKKLILNKNIIKIKNKTKQNYNLQEIAKQKNLKGYFTKEVLQRLENKELTQEEQEKIIDLIYEIL